MKPAKVPRELETVGFSLQEIGQEHAEAIQELARDPALGASSNLPAPFPEDGASFWIRQTRRLRRGGREWSFAVLADEGLVGCCSLLGIGGSPRRGELAYWIGRPFWGKGYATEAARQVIEYGFHELEIEALGSCCLVSNEASRKVLERLGFRLLREGSHPRSGSPFSKWRDEDRFFFFELRRQRFDSAKHPISGAECCAGSP